MLRLLVRRNNSLVVLVVLVVLIVLVLVLVIIVVVLVLLVVLLVLLTIFLLFLVAIARRRVFGCYRLPRARHRQRTCASHGQRLH